MDMLRCYNSLCIRRKYEDEYLKNSDIVHYNLDLEFLNTVVGTLNLNNNMDMGFEFSSLPPVSMVVDNGISDRIMEKYNDIKSTYWKNWEQLSEEEIESWYRRYASQYLNKSNDGQTYDEYMHSSYDLEVYSKHYTSPSGDKLVVFGKYGYDG